MAPPTKLQTALDERTWLVNNLIALEETIKDHDETPMTEGDLEFCLADATLYHTKLQEYQRTIISSADQNEIENHNAIHKDLYKRVLKVKAFCFDEKKKLSETATSSSQCQPKVNTKLKPLELTTFSGSYEEWPSFKDMYESLIHNVDMAKATKLAYLKSYVTGEALVSIKNITTTNDNYDEAWRILKERYDNKRDIVFAQLRKLFKIEHAKQGNIVNIQSLIDQTTQCIGALKVLGQPVDSWDTLLVCMTVDKLDGETKKQWALKLVGTEIPTFKQLKDFIEQHIRGLQAFGVQTKPQHHSEKRVSAHVVSNQDRKDSQCLACKEAHQLMHCKEFMKMSVQERHEFASRNHLCFNCLKKSNHNAWSCRSQQSCKHCKKRHHTMLHSHPDPNSEKKPTSVVSSNAVNQKASTEDDDTEVLLATAVVEIPVPSGRHVSARVMVDTGSQRNIVSEKFVQTHCLRRKHINTKLFGVGGVAAGTCKGMVEITLVSKVYNESITVEALVMPRVTSDLPHFKCSRDYEHVVGLPLADPGYFMPGAIDIILGNEHSFHIMKEGKKMGNNMDGPVAVNTMFGWVLGGKVNRHSGKSESVIVNMCETDTTLQKFFELEQVPAPKHFTEEEKHCEEHFVSTYKRDTAGRFVVRLPFNKKKEELGSSRALAIKRWKTVEKRLENNEGYAKEYSAFMREYIHLQHMQLVARGEEIVSMKGASHYYLPHHFILRLESSTTKFRVVFDGSCKTVSRVSLNDSLMVGATLQNDIFSLLVRFRQYPIAIKADIAKMFRQFRVHEDDCKYQRIVWREKPTDPLQEYELNTVTYGTAAAPFLATRCVIELAEVNKEKYPITAAKMQKDIYVDDLISGVHSETEGKTFITELNEIAESALLSFRKWSSSNLNVLSNIPEDIRECKESSFEKDNNLKALGIMWNPSSDNFSFNQPDCDISGKLTKRAVLSQLARVFDPLGLLTPVTINGKLVMQTLWKVNLNWDEVLTDELKIVWTSYQEQLTNINNISIPRFVKVNHSEKCEIHGFCDASEKAFGACVYVRCWDIDGNISVHLLASKSRVAPSKIVSLPRLELCGALVLAELIEVIKNCQDSQCDVFAWTDSMIVLQWLASHPGRWQTFVANRVSKIQEIIPFEQWNHVKSEENPADMISRGVTAEQLGKSSLWWRGPRWLSTHSLPERPVINKKITLKDSEEKKVSIHMAHITAEKGIIERFSSLNKMKRVIVFVFRFINKCKSKIIQRSLWKKNEKIVCDPIQPEELKQTLHRIIKLVQKTYFHNDYCELESTAKVSNSSDLLALHPFLDEEKLIRVGGRLHNANLPEETKHPIIIPHKSHLTELLINDAHNVQWHAGNKLVWCHLRENYWIISARNAIRFVLRKCVRCRRLRGKEMHQLLGNLPSARISVNPPFYNVGVDFAGPFILKPIIGRALRKDNKEYKGYMCIFVCMATKAVHIEAVSSLSTEAFIETLKRFVSRRGLPSCIYSDQGTNFVGAHNELQRIFNSKEHHDNVINFLSPKNIKWEFNCPSNPHAGGLWEAAVKSAKKHFTSVIGEQRLNFEQFQTVLTQVEACLNSRPLTALTHDVDDISVLTPGHFLIGRSITAVPAPDLTATNPNRLQRWHITEQLSQHFWKRWQREYLTTLQQRWKWKTKCKNISVGDLCVLHDENTPPTQWKMVRVTETHCDQDNLVRRVTVMTNNGPLQRPIVKLSPILFNDEQ